MQLRDVYGVHARTPRPCQKLQNCSKWSKLDALKTASKDHIARVGELSEPWGGSFAKVKKRVPWDWLAWFLTHFTASVAAKLHQGSPTYRGSTTAPVLQRKSDDEQPYSHLLSKRLCSPISQGEQPILE